MKNRMMEFGSVVCSSNSFANHQPYYFVTPGYRAQSAGVRLLHEMCSILNKLGFEAYVDTGSTNGNLWTPALTDAVKLAHYRAGKVPIVVYPEVVKGVPMGLGLPVRYVLNYPGYLGGDKAYTDNELIYTYHQCFYPEAQRLFLPLINLQKIDAGTYIAPAERTQIAYYHNRYSKRGGKVRDFGKDAIEISSTFPATNEETLEILKKSRILYCYEHSGIVIEATLAGCAVVLMPNPITLPDIPEAFIEFGMDGVAWGESEEEIAHALQTVGHRRTSYFEKFSNWRGELQTFIEETQRSAAALPKEKAWPQESLDKMVIPDLPAKEQGAKLDRAKYRRFNECYTRWTEFCTLREIDADIYAEHLAANRVPPLTVLIEHEGELSTVADTLDSLTDCLWQPANVLIVSHSAQPEGFEPQPNLQWVQVSESHAAPLALAAASMTDWVLLVHSGTRLMPQSLVEWGLATHMFSQAQIIYADDDIWNPDGPSHYPCFKPDANIELLRCTNYLGSALLVRTASWMEASSPLFDGGLYRYALELLNKQGKSALGHIDTVLAHTTGQVSSEVESREYAASVSQTLALAPHVRPLERLGTWLIEYAAQDEKCVSVVIPTGIQTGYLRTLLDSFARYPEAALAEVLLVCQPENQGEVDYILGNVSLSIPIRIITCDQVEYNHAVALNTGIQAARSEWIVVCDDDTETLHDRWLSSMLGIAKQADVGCVGPRLMANRGADARVCGGPLVLGINGSAAPYNGEAGLLEEAGVNSRLHLTQDVGAVAGHFFLFHRSHWTRLGGFEVEQFGMWFTVLDFCLRLGQQGMRHVWTPLASVMHQGGKTIENRMRDLRCKLRYADRDITERDNLLKVWSHQLANDPSYNRHLSLLFPYDIENTIVIDWQPKRKDRPRVLAAPLTSGAGQYRVVEPLNALQDASLAQTCAIVPHKRRESRVLQPLELVRAAPDRLILQHSVDDGSLALIDKYRIALPGIHIVQMVDDLLGEVPEKHPNRNYQVREGHQRMVQALLKSDRLVVTTDTLKEHYQKYVPDVRLIPNCLDKQWSGLRLPITPNRRLRVGWIGAGQHKGDLDLISGLVKEFESEVDWVFMGMCTDEIKPHLKEFHQFVSISDYPAKMSSLDLDIAIAPLEDNVFNACKSNLRLLEYGAMGWPVICSDVYPYRYLDAPVVRCPNDLQQWSQALRTLMADAPLRHRMGDQLYNWVQAHFLLKNRVGEWMEAIFSPPV